MRKVNLEYDRFNDTIGKLIKVPRSEIKAKLDAEIREKKIKKRKRKTDDK